MRMRVAIGLFVAAWLALGRLGQAAPIGRADLSPEAQRLLPVDDVVSVVLTDGKLLQGVMVTQNQDRISLRVTEGRISSTRLIPRAAVKEIQPLNVAETLARELLRLQVDPKRSLTSEQYRRSIALFDEFMTRFPNRPEYGAVKTNRLVFAEELARVERTMEKVDGEWMPPIRAAIKRFQFATAEMAGLARQSPGIERPDFKGNLVLKRRYDEVEGERRSVARNLPKLMKDRLPFLIEDRQFDEAVGEVNAFLKFWLTRVVESEARSDDRALYGKGVFEGMDLDYLMQLQRQIVLAYTNAGAGRAPDGRSAATAEEIYVPGGYFLMGRDTAAPNEPDFPMRIVHVRPFVIDRFEVSNAQYRRFVEHVQKTRDSSMEHPQAPPLKDHTPQGWKQPGLSRDRQPVVGVDWYDAYAYAKWAGKRLPTEAEWEKAARGMDGRIFPWGNDEDGKRLVNSPTGRRAVAREMDRQNPPPQPKPKSRFSCTREPPPKPVVTTLPDETWDVDQLIPPQAAGEAYEWKEKPGSAYGAWHMAGNAAEWVSDWYDAGYYAAMVTDNPTGPAEGQLHVFRGGSYLDDGPELRTTWRGVPGNDAMKNGCSPSGVPMIGFRCVRDLPVTAR